MNRGQVADIIGRSALSPYQKLILLCYLSHLPSAQAVGTGLAWPGLQTLATWASCSRSTAQHRSGAPPRGRHLGGREFAPSAPMKVRLDLTRAAEPGRSVQPVPARGRVPPHGTGGCRLLARGVPGAGTGGCRELAPNPPQRTLLNNPP
jgi:hypothetical protein